MKSVLIIDGSKEFWESKTKLTALLCEVAKNELESMGIVVNSTRIDDGYDPMIEMEKFLENDAVIWQFPSWFMGETWVMKKYIDEVFMEIMAKTGGSDGRSSSDPSKRYGTGGKLDRKYMFSSTWNAPAYAFDKGEFFDGNSLEDVYYHLHKAHEFIGMKPLPSFMCNDVVKNPQVDKYVSEYKAHLKKVFG